MLWICVSISLKPLHIAATAMNLCFKFFKTLAYSSKCVRFPITFLKTLAYSSQRLHFCLKPLRIAANWQRANRRRSHSRRKSFHSIHQRWETYRPSHAHTASPRPLARTHDTNTKRNRNRFPNWGSPASINSPQSPIKIVKSIYTYDI